MTDIQLYTRISALPISLKKEVEDFIDFLQRKAKKAEPLIIKRKPGLAKGMIEMKENFDEPMEDFKEYM